MNVGQILETHLGWAGYLIGKQLQELVDRAEARARAELRDSS